MSSYSTMTDNPLVEAVARAVLNDLSRQDGVDGEWGMENGVVDFLDQSPVDMHSVATAALRAIEDAGWKVVKKEEG